MARTFEVGCYEYTVSGTFDVPPATYSALVEHATLHDDFGVEDFDGTALLVTVQRVSDPWPRLVVSQRFDPGPRSGFHSGAIILPDNELLLLGAGTRLLAYDLRTPKRLWEGSTAVGFMGWKRHDDVVVMSAELELAAWNLYGDKLWSSFVEPPWSYDVEGSTLVLDVMGKTSSFDVKAGPRRDRAG